MRWVICLWNRLRTFIRASTLSLGTLMAGFGLAKDDLLSNDVVAMS